VRLLLDQDVFGSTRRELEADGHDVLTARQANLSRAEDSQLLGAAHDDERILVTRDRDFGRLVFVDAAYPGILYLRITPDNLSWVHRELVSVLNLYEEEELRRSFVVVARRLHAAQLVARAPGLAVRCFSTTLREHAARSFGTVPAGPVMPCSWMSCGLTRSCWAGGHATRTASIST